MVDRDFLKRYEREPMIHSVVDMLRGVLSRADLTHHDLARCVVLAAEHHARECNGPITIVLRPQEGPRDYIVNDADLERLVARVKETK